MRLVENKRIRFFERGIEVDTNLPKYKFLKGQKDEEGSINNKITDTPSSLKLYLKNVDSSKFNIKISGYLLSKMKDSFPDNDNSFSDVFLLEGESNMDLDQNLYDRIVRSKTIWGRARSMFDYVFKNRKKLSKIKKDSNYTINVLQLFENIKLEVGKEKAFVDRVDQYVSLVKKAQSLHQVAQEEQLVSKLIIHIYESILSVSGINKYITKEDLINLQSKCEKSLEINYIKNFVRVIPDDVAEKKLKADNLLVFDNYCVLYYDPSGESYSETEKEKEERIKKDPILFGVISGSDKLYYIADWIDEFCDLTLEQVVEKIGEVKKLK